MSKSADTPYGDEVQVPITNAGSPGPQGVQGVQGTQGFQGNLGPMGMTGAQGSQGSQGNQGTQGFQGNQGTQGFQGNQGTQGFQGNQGTQGFQGNQGNQGTQGFQGNQGNQGAGNVQGGNVPTYGSVTLADGGVTVTNEIVSGKAAIAIQVTGEAWPRIVMMADLSDGWYLGTGTSDPTFDGSNIFYDGNLIMKVFGGGAELISDTSALLSATSGSVQIDNTGIAINAGAGQVSISGDSHSVLGVGGGIITLYTTGRVLTFDGLPVGDPHSLGQIYVDSVTKALTVSQG